MPAVIFGAGCPSSLSGGPEGLLFPEGRGFWLGRLGGEGARGGGVPVGQDEWPYGHAVLSFEVIRTQKWPMGCLPEEIGGSIQGLNFFIFVSGGLHTGK